MRHKLLKTFKKGIRIIVANVCIFLQQDAPLSNESIVIDIKEDSEYAYLRNHKINDQVVIPPSFFMVSFPNPKVTILKKGSTK